MTRIQKQLQRLPIWLPLDMGAITIHSTHHREAPGREMQLAMMPFVPNWTKSGV